METTYQPSRLVFVVLFSICSAAATVSAAATSQMARPGFSYTRTRGRCTPEFWSSRREAWPRMVPQTSTLSKVFGSRVYERYRSDLTLLESTTRNDDDGNAFAGLVKEATAALLNSYARPGFGYSAWEVKTLVIQALVSEAAAARQAKQFSVANQACN
ncbi:Pollen Ole e I family allergen [Melia azedarach]|uniref:Pollen Ole e I family allergen n=1 Tax=Melia azedarach TaxID=155640 RepID=A0ACC1YV05_MELAZ|nr:Pollen Ole e I family allergen [Melia azedarach]